MSKPSKEAIEAAQEFLDTTYPSRTERQRALELFIQSAIDKIDEKFGPAIQRAASSEPQEWTDLDYNGDWNKIKAKHNAALAAELFSKLQCGHLRQFLRRGNVIPQTCMACDLAAEREKREGLERANRGLYRESNKRKNGWDECVVLLNEEHGVVARLVEAAREALVPVAAWIITDQEEPYANISDTLRQAFYRAHDLLLAALAQAKGGE
jgi:hypothetical protein